MLDRIRSSVAVAKPASEGDTATRPFRLRRIVAPLRVAAWRVTRRPSRLALAAAGVALATATLVGISAGTLALRERTLHSALTNVVPADRSFRADEFGLAFSVSPSVAKAAEEALALVT